MTPRIHIIGIEPGARVLPAGAREAVHSGTLLVGARRHLDLAPDFSGEALAVEGRITEVVERVAANPKLRTAFLASGDPGFFGIAGTILRRIPREEVRIWPAVSSMQLAFARAGETWSEARLASLHGRPLEALAPILGSPKIGLFTDPTNTPAAVAHFLTDSGWDDLDMVVAEDLGLPQEKIARGSVRDFHAWQGSDMNVVLLLGGADLRPLGPGLPEEAFSHSRGLITKAEVRAAALALLRLPREGILWDVGAGSGSLSIEACLLAPALRAYAVDRSPEQLAHLAENRKRFCATALVPVAGEAPEALTGLPDPDAVFLGGSGGRLDRILEASWSHLRPRGSLVVASVLLETLSETLRWSESRGIEPEISEIRSSRSRLVGGKHLLEPQNPVTLVAFRKRPHGGGTQDDPGERT